MRDRLRDKLRDGDAALDYRHLKTPTPALRAQRPGQRHFKTTDPANLQKARPARKPPQARSFAFRTTPIARHYATLAARRSGSRDTRIMRFRCRDLERLFHDLHGDALPNNAIGRDHLFVMAQAIAGREVMAGRSGKVIAAIVAWAGQWCAWLPRHDAEAFAGRVLYR